MVENKEYYNIFVENKKDLLNENYISQIELYDYLYKPNQNEQNDKDKLNNRLSVTKLLYRPPSKKKYPNTVSIIQPYRSKNYSNQHTFSSHNESFNKRSLFILSQNKNSSNSNCENNTYKNTECNLSLNYCNNCGKSGHSFYQCKNPITSYGIIVFRYENNPVTGEKERQYLMIRRRDTISYVDFLRGKYSLFNRKYIKRLISDMTEYEQNQIMTQPFEYLWYELWKNNEPNPNDVIRETYKTFIEENPNSTFIPTHSNQPKNYKNNENYNLKDKFNILQNGWCINGKQHFKISDIIAELRMEYKISNTEPWKEPEWGFCKGRRNYKENDYDCAIREMEEETGYSKENMSILKNINTFEEVFIGSNYKSYKHKYYLMYMTFENSLKTGDFERTEVSCIKWVSFHECLKLIRSYNIEKKRMITEIETALNNYAIFT